MRLQLPYIDRIWRVQNDVVIDEQLDPAQGFDRMAPLFQTQGTEVDLDGDTLVYKKTNPAAQDKLATFTSGTLHLSRGPGGTTLNYDVSSTALLLCFLAPLLFLGFALLAIGLNTIDPVIEDRGSETASEEKEEEEKVRELHWFDQMLGVPAPEAKDKDGDEEKSEDSRRGDEDEDKKEKHNPIPAYILAGIFAAIYAVGRVLEPYLLRRTFRTALKGGFVATPTGAVLREKAALFGVEVDADVGVGDVGDDPVPNPDDREGKPTG